MTTDINSGPYRLSFSPLKRAVPIGAGVLAIVVGALVLIGWHLDIEFLKYPFSNEAPVRVNASVAFILSGIALILLQRHSLTNIVIVRLLGLIISLIGILSLFENLSGVNLGIDDLLVPHSEKANALHRMPINAAMNLSLLGISFILLAQKLKSRFFLEFFLIFSFSMSVIVLLGYATGLDELTGVGASAVTKMPLVASMTFIIVCVGMIFTAYQQQQSSVTIEQKLLAGLTTAAAIIIFITFFSVSGITSLVQSSDWIEHTQEVKNQINLILSHVLEVQSGERGFVLTGNDDYLAARNKALDELPALMHNIQIQTADNPQQQKTLGVLERLVHERMAFSALITAIRKTEGETKARLLFSTGKGKMIVDGIRVLVAQMLAEEDRLLQTRRSDGVLQANRNQLIIYLSLGVQVLLLAFIFVVVNRDVTGRRKAEEELKEKSEELDRFFTHTLDLLCIADINGFFRRLNKAWESTLGYTLQDLEGKPFLDFVHPDDVQETLGAMSDLSKDKEVLSFTNRYRRKDGSYRWIEWRSFPVGNLIYASARDVTEKKRAEEALKESEQRLVLALDSGQMGAWDLDLLNDTSVRSLKHDQIFGYDALLPQWGAEIFMKHVVPEDREQVQEKFQKAFADGNLQFECRIIRRDKSLRWIAAQGHAYRNEEGTPVRMMGVVSDITERKQAEDRFRLVVESAPNAIILIDSEGTIRLVNNQTERYFGYNRDELLGKKIEMLVPKEHAVDHPALCSSFFSHPDVRSMGKGRDLSGLRKDGSHIPIELGLSSIHFEDEMLVLASIIDITERKRAEENIRHAHAQLKVANKELGAFSYSVSHDLRAPLRHIAGFVGLLQKHAGTSLDEKSTRYLETISQATVRMGSLIDDLLSFSRMGRQEMQKATVDMNEMIAGIARDLEAHAKGRTIEWKIEKFPPVKGDHAMLRLMMVNLLQNAAKFTSKKEKAVIEVGCEIKEKEITGFVKDNGAGFDMKYADKLFSVFQRLHNAEEFEGTGIGLANVQRIIHRHGGRTWAEGKVNEGAAFYFTIPLDTEERSSL